MFNLSWDSLLSGQNEFLVLIVSSFRSQLACVQKSLVLNNRNELGLSLPVIRSKPSIHLGYVFTTFSGFFWARSVLRIRIYGFVVSDARVYRYLPYVEKLFDFFISINLFCIYLVIGKHAHVDKLLLIYKKHIFDFDKYIPPYILITAHKMEPRKQKPKKRVSSGLYVKVIVLGDSGVGKTCLINRYVGGFYQDSFATTLGVDFKVKEIVRNQVKMNLQIWDTAGQERFKTITKSYFQGCLGVLLVFSLTDLESFRNIEKWLLQLEEYADKKLVKVLVGAKVDSPDQRVVQVNECSEIASKYDLEYFEVSAKTGYNVQNIFETIADKILLKKQNSLSHFYRSKFIKLTTCEQQFPNFKSCQC